MNIKKFLSIQNRIPLFIGLSLIIINILIIFPFGLHNYSFESQASTPVAVFLSASIYIGYIIFCIFIWIKRYSTLAKGLFLYQFTGALSFAVYFICYIFGIDFQIYPYKIFHAWTLLFEPFTVLLARISGIHVKFITALFYLLLTFITGKVVIAIKKDIEYEKKYKEDHNII